jgi:BirA family biotin operon repressor/biotin-[acetyl-CoA-carboxylase] ligase
MTPREEWSLAGQRLGRRVLVFDRLDSTNSYAAGLADDPANDGVAVLADEQTRGRGQHGRSWTAPPGSAVLLSLLLFPPPALRRPAVLTAWAAVTVCATVRQTIGESARIKWPNDVLVRDRKVCGILIEQGRGVVVGVGLNVRQRGADFAAAGLPDAASLASFVPAPPETAAIARQLLHQLDAEYEALLRGELAALEACWQERLGLEGRRVRAACPEGVHEGCLRAVGFDGVALEGDDGELVVLPPERVQHLEALPAAV